MSSAQRQAIYDRLASAPTFHPLSADLFTDWNLQAGDVVTVQSGDESYASPIYSMRMKWSGAPKVEVESTGNTEREPLPAMDRKQYGMGAGMGGMQKEQERVDGILYDAGLYYNQYGVFMYATAEGNGTKLGASFKVMADRIDSVVEKTGVDNLGNNETLYSKITQTATDITMLVSRTGINNLGQSETLFSRIQQTAESIELLVNRTGINNLGKNETLYSRIYQTAESINIAVGRIDSELNEMSGRIDVESNRIGLVVTQKNGQNVVNAASIVLGINNQDKHSSSYVDISADKINLSGYVTAESFSALYGAFNQLVTGESTVGSLKAQLIQANTIRLGSSRLIKTPLTINGATVNVLTLG